ncbi:hypothetical protein CANCADRAFT_43448 [Tortispora caseinolytica NRRL Y-17796]|uniref:ER membrane protein complex subunit 1 n=1 Tax=Tortispora caseinolytica NRRL Y-17796 TaxID=767744 RepID=A0A1E4TMA0_9ASCO|nr:hypothetical protein CANCADRAFT_43448 [Tortispora caseinolytica NRRL Y-17796]
MFNILILAIAVAAWHLPSLGLFDCINSALIEDQLLFAGLSSSNILAAINITDGSTLWRHHLPNAYRLVASKTVAVLEYVPASNSTLLKIYDSLDGLILNEMYLPHPAMGLSQDDAYLYIYSKPAMYQVDWAANIVSKEPKRPPPRESCLKTGTEYTVGDYSLVVQPEGGLQTYLNSRLQWTYAPVSSEQVVFVDKPYTLSSPAPVRLGLDLQSWKLRWSLLSDRFKVLLSPTSLKRNLHDYLESKTHPDFGLEKIMVRLSTDGSLHAIDTVDPKTELWSTDSLLPRNSFAHPILVSNETIYVANTSAVFAIHGITGDITSTHFGCVSANPGWFFLVDGIPAYISQSGESVHIDNTPYTPDNDLFLHASTDKDVRGYVLEKGKPRIRDIWHFKAPKGFSIRNTAVKDPADTVGSVGRVLGDRSALFKYLYPNAMAVIMVNDVTGEVLFVLLDLVSGQPLVTYEGDKIDPNTPILLTYGEHYVVATYLSITEQTRATVILVWDLYESYKPNIRLTRPLESSALKKNLKPAVYFKSYLFDADIVALSFSRTLHGITSKNLLLATREGRILSMPRMFLDGRRPVYSAWLGDSSRSKKSPLSKVEAMEGLIAYEPEIPDNEKLLISGASYVHGTRHIVCYPSHLESTLHVVSYGEDIFYTQISPSNTFDMLPETFSKSQIVLTCAALTIAVYILKRLADRKQVRHKWKVAT